MKKRYALAGRDIQYSLSPEIHSSIMRIAGVEGEYTLCDIPDFELIKREIPRLDGFNVTKPYKLEAQIWTGADAPVNTVLCGEGGLKGFNTDIDGFIYPIKEQGIGLKNKAVLVLGSGGAAESVMMALVREGAAAQILARNTQAAEEIVRRRGGELFGGGSPYMIVNCTTLGRKSGENPLADSIDIAETAILYDLIYSPQTTEFLRSFPERDMLRINGLRMLIAQAAYAQAVFGNLTIDSFSDIKYVCKLVSESIRSKLQP